MLYNVTAMKERLPRLLDDLNLYRLERGMSQAKVAKQLSVTFQTVSRWFNGHNRPNAIQTYRIKKLLKERP
jgi:transcriptional regulator with XRE-family HTH domain